MSAMMEAMMKTLVAVVVAAAVAGRLPKPRWATLREKNFVYASPICNRQQDRELPGRGN
jgi:hypothetical protein